MPKPNWLTKRERSRREERKKEKKEREFLSCKERTLGEKAMLKVLNNEGEGGGMREAEVGLNRQTVV